MELASKYEKLKSDSEASDHPIRFIKINPQDKLCHIYLFHSKSGGPFLGIFHNNGEVILKERPLIRGLEIDEVEENGRRGATLKPTRESGLDVFFSLCDHLVNTLSDDSDPNRISRNLLRELKLWKLFFSNSVGPLSKERLLGFAGELFTLETLLDDSDKNSYQVIHGWEGPNRGLHDFSYEACLFEVKSSTLSTEMYFNIFSPTQLTETDGKNLYLIHQVFSWEASGISINNLVSRLKKKLADNKVASSIFDELISLSGYHKMHHDYYETQEFRLSHVKTDTYGVDADFPKVLASDTHSSIRVHGYSIEVEGCAEQLLGSFEDCVKGLEWN